MKFRQVANWDGHGLNPGIQVFGLSCFQNLLAVYPTNGRGFPGPQRAKLANDLAKPPGHQTARQFAHAGQNTIRFVRGRVHVIAPVRGGFEPCLLMGNNWIGLGLERTHLLEEGFAGANAFRFQFPTEGNQELPGQVVMAKYGVAGAAGRVGPNLMAGSAAFGCGTKADGLQGSLRVVMDFMAVSCWRIEFSMDAIVQGPPGQNHGGKAGFWADFPLGME